ncbi:MAG: AAA family ATPase [Candidatus Thermoplasmatota archaeon]|nr:AAA family ATPase [Candidatus Thermoplasmatota archaeon]
MICLTGIPGSGKTTVAAILRSRGIRVMNVSDLPGFTECNEEDGVDIDCLRSKITSYVTDNEVIEGHYSHLLPCEAVIILERAERNVEQSLRGRGYSSEKISDNIDALRSDIIFSESLEYLPSPRIFRVSIEENFPGIAAEQCIRIITQVKTKVK